MKTLLGVFAIIQLITTCVNLPQSAASEINTFVPAASSAAVTCEGTFGPLCASDGVTLMTCGGNAQSVSNSTCPLYCANNECQSFRCTSKGTFPDPTDCSTYYYCSGINTIPTKYTCPSGYVFTLEEKMCTIGNNCQTPNCMAYQNQFIQYNSLNKGYYVLCDTHPVMFKCPDAEAYIYDAAVHQCVYNCPCNGSFINPFNCAEYMSCQSVSGAYTAISIPCPPGYYFNGLQCILGSCQTQYSYKTQLRYQCKDQEQQTKEQQNPIPDPQKGQDLQQQKENLQRQENILQSQEQNLQRQKQNLQQQENNFYLQKQSLLHQQQVLKSLENDFNRLAAGILTQTPDPSTG